MRSRVFCCQQTLSGAGPGSTFWVAERAVWYFIGCPINLQDLLKVLFISLVFSERNYTEKLPALQFIWFICFLGAIATGQAISSELAGRTNWSRRKAGMTESRSGSSAKQPGDFPEVASCYSPVQVKQCLGLHAGGRSQRLILQPLMQLIYQFIFTVDFHCAACL